MSRREPASDRRGEEHERLHGLKTPGTCVTTPDAVHREMEGIQNNNSIIICTNALNHVSYICILIHVLSEVRFGSLDFQSGLRRGGIACWPK